MERGGTRSKEDGRRGAHGEELRWHGSHGGLTTTHFETLAEFTDYLTVALRLRGGEGGGGRMKRE